MHHLKRTGFSSIKKEWPKPRGGLGSLMECANKPTKRLSNVGLGFSSVATVNHLAGRAVLGAGGAAVKFRGHRAKFAGPSFARTFASTASEWKGQTLSLVNMIFTTKVGLGTIGAHAAALYYMNKESRTFALNMVEVYGKTLERIIEEDSQISAKIGQLGSILLGIGIYCHGKFAALQVVLVHGLTHLALNI